MPSWCSFHVTFYIISSSKGCQLYNNILVNYANKFVFNWTGFFNGTISEFSGMLEPTYRQLQAMKLERSPFVIISVVGQELLAQGQFTNAVEVLEAALRIGTCSLKLRGSVFSALSSAYWALNTLDKVILNNQAHIFLTIYVTSFSSIPYCHNSEFWSLE